MTIARLPVLGLLQLLLPATAWAEPVSCPQFFPGGQPPALANPRLAQRTTLLCNDAYAALASGITRGAMWSAEHLTRAGLEQARGTPRQGEFHPDDRLPSADQAQLADYRRSGYDRGHMSPSGDMPGGAAQQQSFSLANMVPQTPELNRGVWSGIEMATRGLAERRGDLYVVTGPAFAGQQIQSIGPGGVLVPSSTWKAVYDPGVQAAGVYLCGNTAVPTCEVMSVAALVRLVGIDPFPAISARTKEVTMTLPEPEGRHDSSSRHQRQRRKPPGFFEQLFGLQERS